MDRWYKEKPELMLIPFGTMKTIVLEWLHETFGVYLTWLKPKGRYNIINFVVMNDDIKVSMDIFVSEFVSINDDNLIVHAGRYYGMNRVIPEDAYVSIDRVWMVITDLETKKRVQHDILTPMRYHDRNRLMYDMRAFKMQEYLGGSNTTLKLRDALEKESIWRIINE